LNAVFIGASLSTGLVFGVVLVAPPYDWKESNVGLMGIPLAVAGILSVLISGIGADIIIRWKEKRNNGIHEVTSFTQIEKPKIKC
jgi:MFS-type transporter involved in bile tolerance (Atg22 family)